MIAEMDSAGLDEKKVTKKRATKANIIIAEKGSIKESEKESAGLDSIKESEKESAGLDSIKESEKESAGLCEKDSVGLDEKDSVGVDEKKVTKKRATKATVIIAENLVQMEGKVQGGGDKRRRNKLLDLPPDDVIIPNDHLYFEHYLSQHNNNDILTETLVDNQIHFIDKHANRIESF
jgi:hypothetical protein